jgi:hypothetical protein
MSKQQLNNEIEDLSKAIDLTRKMMEMGVIKKVTGGRMIKCLKKELQELNPSESLLIYEWEDSEGGFLTIKKINQSNMICAVSGCDRPAYYLHETGRESEGTCFATCEDHIQRDHNTKK